MTPIHLGDLVAGAADRPAREALVLAQRHWAQTLGRATFGAALMAAASLGAALIEQASGYLAPRTGHVDGLRAAMEALVIVLPGLLVFSVYLRLHLSPRVVGAAVSLGLLIGGVVATATLPLLAFLTLTVRSPRGPVLVLQLAAPLVALGAAAIIPTRVFTALDRRFRARGLAYAYALALFTAFALRCAVQA